MRCSECNEVLEPGEAFLFSEIMPGPPRCSACFIGEEDPKGDREPEEKPWKATAGFPEHMHGASVERADVPQACRSWVKSGKKALTMTGATGTGKTWLACSLAYRMHDYGSICRFVDAVELINIYRGVAMRGEWEAVLLRLLRGADVVILDDLGTQGDRGMAYESIYDFINTVRGRLIVTTNLTADQMQESMDERIVSRLLGGYVVKFEGGDLRCRGQGKRIETVKVGAK